MFILGKDTNKLYSCIWVHPMSRWSLLHNRPDISKIEFIIFWYKNG